MQLNFQVRLSFFSFVELDESVLNFNNSEIQF